ncbi:MAG: hypothetical protein RJA44_2320 [Pseudomonadota bacterium]
MTLTATPTRDRLQPALLDRLTDLAPHDTVEPLEVRVISRKALRDAVLRDLGWLLNTVQPMLESPDDAALVAAQAPTDPFSSEELDARLRLWPEVRDSVLNYGLPPISGQLASRIDIPLLERSLRETLLRFEPRLLEQGLIVRAQESSSVLDTHNIIAFEIRGLLWAQPVPLELLLRTELDLEAGQVQVVDLDAARLPTGAR